MNRAQRRRLKKKEEKAPAKYVFTKETLDAYVKQAVEQEYQKKIERAKEAAMAAATDYAIMLLLALPLEVLKDHYWKKSYKKRLPKFMDHLMEYYKRWQTDEISTDQMNEDLLKYAGIRLEDL